MVDRTVGVVDPSLGRREVVARPVRVVGQHPAPQLPRRRAEHLPLPAGHGHAKVAHLARPRRAVHSRYLPMMSMIRPMSSRAAASGVRFSVPSTMHSWSGAARAGRHSPSPPRARCGRRCPPCRCPGSPGRRAGRVRTRWDRIAARAARRRRFSSVSLKSHRSGRSIQVATQRAPPGYARVKVRARPPARAPRLPRHPAAPAWRAWCTGRGSCCPTAG